MKTQPRVAVTGGMGAIGSAIAEMFRQRGCQVTVIDKREGPGHVRCDLTDRSQFDLLPHRIGPIDMLINAAGIYPGGTELSGSSQKTIQDVLFLNAIAGPLLTEGLIKTYGGELSVVVSIGSLAHEYGKNILYGISKGGIAVATQFMARQHAKLGLAAYCLEPGPVTGTPMYEDIPKDHLKH